MRKYYYEKLCEQQKVIDRVGQTLQDATEMLRRLQTPGQSRPSLLAVHQLYRAKGEERYDSVWVPGMENDILKEIYPLLKKKLEEWIPKISKEYKKQVKVYNEILNRVKIK